MKTSIKVLGMALASVITFSMIETSEAIDTVPLPEKPRQGRPVLDSDWNEVSEMGSIPSKMETPRRKPASKVFRGQNTLPEYKVGRNALPNYKTQFKAPTGQDILKSKKNRNKYRNSPLFEPPIDPATLKALGKGSSPRGK
jgi:hypothetical protein